MYSYNPTGPQRLSNSKGSMCEWARAHGWIIIGGKQEADWQKFRMHQRARRECADESGNPPAGPQIVCG